MRFSLICHPDTPCAAVRSIDVELVRPHDGVARLHYIVSGDIAAVALPARTAPARADRLWEHTCFEAFARGAGEGYCEFNFSPSTQWAAYAFDGYRSNMRNAESAAPHIHILATAERFDLQAMIDLGDVVAHRLALSAVIEETSGAKSYWALAHPPGKPDFHHADSFAYELAP
jgi:hypothetical protein